MEYGEQAFREATTYYGMMEILETDPSFFEKGMSKIYTVLKKGLGRGGGNSLARVGMRFWGGNLREEARN